MKQIRVNGIINLGPLALRVCIEGVLEVHTPDSVSVPIDTTVAQFVDERVSISKGLVSSSASIVDAFGEFCGGRGVNPVPLTNDLWKHLKQVGGVRARQTIGGVVTRIWTRVGLK